MTEVLLHERGDPVMVELPPTVAEFLATEKIADVVSTGHGRFVVTAKTKVGVVSIDGWTIRIAPKLDDINHLVFLLGYAKDPGWRTSPVAVERNDDFVSALADAFTVSATATLARGLLQGYRETEDELPVLRGRLREQEQITRRFALPIPVLVRFDDYTVNIAENQLLRTAAERLLRVPGIRGSTIESLRRIRISLADADSIRPGVRPPTWHRTRLNERYATSLSLAELICAHTSFAHRIGKQRATGFLVDMAKVFEDFLAAALGASLERRSGRCHANWQEYLDVDQAVRMRLDLLWRSTDGQARAVIDAKYKAEKPAGFPNADQYQLLAYCTALRLREGHLVYAKGNDVARSHEVRHVGIRIHTHTLDLALRPDDLLASVENLAGRIASGVIPSVGPRA